MLRSACGPRRTNRGVQARHVGVLPTEDGGYSGQLQKEITAADDMQTKVLAAQKRRATLQTQLQLPRLPLRRR